jgi:hypothetical protein
MTDYWNQAQAASAADNLTGLAQVSSLMNILANQAVMYLYTGWNYNFLAMTSNVQGFQYNPALSTSGGGVAGPQLFVELY